jgi:hypothetical protein
MEREENLGMPLKAGKKPLGCHLKLMPLKAVGLVNLSCGKVTVKSGGIAWHMRSAFSALRNSKKKCAFSALRDSAESLLGVFTDVLNHTSNHIPLIILTDIILGLGPFVCYFSF